MKILKFSTFVAVLLTFSAHGFELPQFLKGLAGKNPSVVSINRGVTPSTNPTTAGTVTFAITFNKPIVSLASSDFVITNTGSGSASINSVSGSSKNWSVSVNTSSIEGNIGLNFNDADSSVIGSNGATVSPSTHTSDQVWSVDNVGPSVVTINRGSSPFTNPTNANSVEFSVTFSESVATAVVAGDFTVSNNGVGSPSVTSVSGGPSVYTVSVNTTGVNGDVGLDFNDANNTVQDSLGNAANPSTHTADQVWTVSQITPKALSIVRGTNPGVNPTNDTLVEFEITFNTNVTNVTTNDFCVTNTGTGSPQVDNVSGSGNSRVVEVETTGVEGEVGLDLCDFDSSIVDIYSNSLVPNNRASDETYEIDTVEPSVVSINRGSSPGSNPTSASSVEFQVTFSESIGSAVVAGDFSVTNTGTGSPAISSITGGPTVYTVTVDTWAVNGDVGLDFNDANQTVTDAVGNSMNPSTHSSDQEWSVDNTQASVLTINRGSYPSVNPTNSSTVEFVVTFSETIINVTTGDFCITNTGVGSPYISGVSGSGSTRVVQVNAAGVDGDVGVDLCDFDNSITDTVGNPLMVSSHSSDQTWSVDTLGPSVVTINRGSVPATNPTNASVVEFDVTFTESVTSLVSGDFCLTNTGIGSASISGITGSGTVRTVSVNVSGVEGDVGLDVCDFDSSISDALGNLLNPSTATSDQEWTIIP